MMLCLFLCLFQVCLFQACNANWCPLSFVHINIFSSLQKQAAHVDLSEGKGASDRTYRECIFLGRLDASLHCCARPSLTRSDADTGDVGGQLYLNSIRMRQMNGSTAVRQSYTEPSSHLNQTD